MTKQFPDDIIILRRPQVERKTGLSRSAIYQKVHKGNFPKPINLGERSVGWIESEINAWLCECAANRDQNSAEKSIQGEHHGREGTKEIYGKRQGPALQKHQ
jgi:prophage regulatory protein